MTIRSETLENAPLRCAPRNELGVVYLFTQYAKRHRMKVEEIRPGFPDCIVYQQVAHGEKLIRIESEYRSSNFRSHRHDPKKCDWIVCWEHDWVGIPERLRVIELKKFYGKGLNIWIQPVVGICKQPTHGNAFVYLGRNTDMFVGGFSRFGVVAAKF